MREIAKDLTDGLWILGDGCVIKEDAATGGTEEGGDDLHEGGFACAIGPEQAKHALIDG